MHENQYDSESAEQELRRAVGDLLSCTSFTKEYRLQPEDTLRSLAGPILPKMLYRREDAEPYLSVGDKNVRIAALLILSHYWKPTSRFAQRCEQLALRDADQQVRGIALFSLLRCYRFIDERVKAFICQVIKESKIYEEGVIACATSGLATGISSLTNAPAGQIGEKQLQQALAGPELECMSKSREATEEYLSSPNPRLRMTALLLLHDQWKDLARLKRVCAKMVADETDDQVRQLVLRMLGVVYADTDDRSVGRMLAGIVRSETESLGSRRSAYSALFQLRGLPARTWPIFQFRGRRSWTPDDVDLAFVRSFQDD